MLNAARSMEYFKTLLILFSFIVEGTFFTRPMRTTEIRGNEARRKTRYVNTCMTNKLRLVKRRPNISRFSRFLNLHRPFACICSN